MVRKWNHLKGDSLIGRRTLYIHLPISPAAARDSHVASKSSSKKKAATQASNSVQHHRVKQGETLYSIASSYNTTVEALQRDNRNVATLRPGMVLIIRP
jgi:LysM repeat protein